MSPRARRPSQDQAPAPVAAPADERAPDEQERFGNAFVADRAKEHGGDAADDPAGLFEAATEGASDPLPYRGQMERAFGQDFSGVDVHLGAEAPLAGMGAGAAAAGETVAFADAQPSLEQVAHELTHVVQNRGAGKDGLQADTGSVSTPGAPAEAEAEQAASDVAAGRTPTVGEAPAAGIQRDPLDGGVADAGVPDVAGVPLPPYDRLREAVDGGDADRALSVYPELDATDRTRLVAEVSLLRRFCQLIPSFSAETILGELRPPLAVWLDVATLCFSGDSAALTRTLQANGITTAATLGTHLASVANRAPFANAAVLRPIVSAGALADQAPGVQSGALAAFLAASFPLLPPHLVLPALDSATLLTAVGVPATLAWLSRNPPMVSPQVLAWSTAADWYRVLRPIAAPFLQALIAPFAPAWGVQLRDAFNAGTLDVALLLPDDALSTATIGAIAMVDPALPATLTARVPWDVPRVVRVAEAQGWLTLANFRAHLQARRAGHADEMTIAQDATLVPKLQPLGYPNEVFFHFTEKPKLLPAAYQAAPPLQTWLGSDLVKFAALIAGGGRYREWAVALVDGGKVDVLLQLAGGTDDAAVGTAWSTAVNGAGKFDAVVAAATAPITDVSEYRGLGRIFGNGKGKSLAQCQAVFAKMCTAVIPPAGDQRVWTDGETGLTDSSVAGATWDSRKYFTAQDPTVDVMRSTIEMIAPMQPSLVNATDVLVFANQAEFKWFQTAPVTSTTWHSFSIPMTETLDTSYAYWRWLGDGSMSNAVVMRSTSSTRARPDGSAIGHDRNGVADSVGGGARKRGVDNRTTVDEDTGRNDALTYFENHARHEFGHSVGARQYQGVAQTGNSFAESYGSWVTHSTSAAMEAGMFTATGAGTLRSRGKPDQAVSAADVSAWLAGVIGAQPPAAAANPITLWAGTNGLSVRKVMDSIGAVSDYASTDLFRYVRTVLAANGYNPASAAANAYQYTGFTPSGTMHIFSTRWNNQWAEYSNAFATNARQSMGWYSMSSPAECFAEMFTKWYSNAGAPAAIGSNNPDTFFGQLEASPGAVPNPTAYQPYSSANNPMGAPTATETEPTAPWTT